MQNGAYSPFLPISYLKKLTANAALHISRRGFPKKRKVAKIREESFNPLAFWLSPPSRIHGEFSKFRRIRIESLPPSIVVVIIIMEPRGHLILQVDPIRRNKYFVKQVWQKVWYEGRKVPRTLRHPAAILSKPLGKSRDTIILTNVNETRQGWNNTQPVQRGSIDPPLPSFFQNLARPTD